ncbi:MAG: tetratricopeptide repeat protein, partial [Methyloceanibacter sp.]
MRFRAPTFISAAAAALLITATPASAEKAVDDCFNGKLSVQEVLDACATFIASGSDDKKLLIRAHSVRALGYSATGSLDKAMKEMDLAVELDPKRANSYFMRAAGHDAKRDYSKAIADLDEAISINDKDADYYLLRGIVYSHTNDLDKALADLNKKVELDPKATN